MQKDSCFNCRKQGHWARDCPSISPRKTPLSVNGGTPTGSSRDHPPIQCRCGNGTCLVHLSKTEKNPGRYFYSCPVQGAGKCRFFKWVDEVKDSNIRTSPEKASPKCPCGAGICKKEKKISGPDAGRSCFVCPIKRGLGACPFFQWEDTLVDIKVNDHGDGSKGYGSPLSTCDSHSIFDIVNNDLRKTDDNLSLEQPGRLEFGLKKVDIARVPPSSTIIPMLSAEDDALIIENQESGKTSDILSANQHDPSPVVLPENGTSVLESAKGNLVLQEAESWDSVVGKEAVVGLMSRSVIRSRQMEFWSQISAAADSSRDATSQNLGLHFLGWLGRLAFPPSWCLTDHPPAPFFCVIFPSFDPISVPQDRDMICPERTTALSHRLSNSGKGKLSPSLPGRDVQLWNGDLQKSSGIKCASTAMDENEMSTFKKFFEEARLLVNQLAMILNSTNHSDPDSMTRRAHDLFSALKSIDSNPITMGLKEFAHSSLRLGAIEQSLCNERSVEELIELNYNEKVRFDDISKAYEKAVTNLTALNEREQSLQDEASRVRDLLSQIEDQLSCCQAETSELKAHVDIISRDMVESKKRKEKAEEALELRKQKEKECLSAKAALEKISQNSSQEICGWHIRKRQKMQNFAECCITE